jgi:outer membrane protein assembly factor BamD (BamD/ComL family)
VGRFYYKSKHYRAALARFQGVLHGYEDVLEPKGREEIEALAVACKEKLVASGAEGEGERPRVLPMESGFGGDLF